MNGKDTRRSNENKRSSRRGRCLFQILGIKGKEIKRPHRSKEVIPLSPKEGRSVEVEESSHEGEGNISKRRLVSGQAFMVQKNGTRKKRMLNRLGESRVKRNQVENAGDV